MEGKNNSPPPSSSSRRSFTLLADESFGRKDADPSARSSSSYQGYFSTVIPPASAVIAKDLSHSDLCWTLNKQRVEGRIASARCTNAAGRSQGSPGKKPITQNKDGKPVYPNESTEAPYFGSSVNYGARDFYTSSSSNQTTESSTNVQEAKKVDGYPSDTQCDRPKKLNCLFYCRYVQETISGLRRQLHRSEDA
ncbi:hypothetical protein MUK42_11945, partial [Musa troglodytarum]